MSEQFALYVVSLLLQKQIETDSEKTTITEDIMMVTQDGDKYQLITNSDNTPTLHNLPWQARCL